MNSLTTAIGDESVSRGLWAFLLWEEMGGPDYGSEKWKDFVNKLKNRFYY